MTSTASTPATPDSAVRAVGEGDALDSSVQDTETCTLDIGGMTCASCVRRIE